jgi:hypothetical protein
LEGVAVRPSQAKSGILILATLVLVGCAGSTLRSGSAAGSFAESTAQFASMRVRTERLTPSVPNVMLPTAQRFFHQHASRVVGGPLAHPLSKGALYDAHYYHNDAGIYQKNGTSLEFVGSLGGLINPQGVATTRTNYLTLSSQSGLLLIANTGASNVPIYVSTPKGPIGPLETLDDSGQWPVDVDASRRAGIIAVSNYTTTEGSAGSVSIYADGATSPTSMLRIRGNVQGVGIVIDRHGNCLWSYNDYSSGHARIAKFTNCAGHGKVIASGFGYAGGLTVDRYDNLYYIDQQIGVFKCEGETNCKLLNDGFTVPMFLNFDSKWENLWVSDASGYIWAIDPNTGEALSSTPTGDGDPPYGVAPAPAARY